MVKGEAFWELLQSTKTKCDKECAKCEMFLKTKNRCIHEDLRLWKKWTEEEHKKLEKLIKV